jgi:hypothetical protein
MITESATMGQKGMAKVWEASGDVARSLVSFRCTVVLSLALVVIFLLVGFVWEGWSPFISLYVLTQLITTIGFGDITPKSAEQKLCFCVMIIMCLIMVAHSVQKVFQAIQSREEKFLCKAISLWRKSISESGVYHAADRLRVNRDLLNFYISSTSFACSIGFGVVFFAIVEPCTCSLGGKNLVGCISSSRQACKQSGGYEKSWIDCLYFSFVSLTTVGFGDFAPTTTLGRAVGMIWMISGVFAVGNWIATISTVLFDEGQVRRRAESKHVVDITKIMDVDGDGFISRSEHHMYMLLRNGMVSLETVRALDTQYNALSAEGDSDRVSIYDVQLAFATGNRPVSDASVEESRERLETPMERSVTRARLETPMDDGGPLAPQGSLVRSTQSETIASFLPAPDHPKININFVD